MKIEIDRQILMPEIKRLCIDVAYDGLCPHDSKPLVLQFVRVLCRTATKEIIYIEIPMMMCPICSSCYISPKNYKWLSKKLNAIDLPAIKVNSKISECFCDANMQGVPRKKVRTYPLAYKQWLIEFENDISFGFKPKVRWVRQRGDVCLECKQTLIPSVQIQINILYNGINTEQEFITSLPFCLNCKEYIVDEQALQHIMHVLNKYGTDDFFSFEICNGKLEKSIDCYKGPYRFLLNQPKNYKPTDSLIKKHPRNTSENKQNIIERSNEKFPGVYLFRNNCHCLSCFNKWGNNDIRSEMITIMSYKGIPLIIKVHICMICGKRYINESMYINSIRKNGGLYLHIIPEEPGRQDGRYANYRSMSILKQYGYSVSEQYNLSENARREIIHMLLSEKLAKQYELIELLDRFIKDHSSPKFWKARGKWESDRKYLHDLPVDIDNSSRVIPLIDKRTRKSFEPL